jgi:hypothetical protein
MMKVNFKISFNIYSFLEDNLEHLVSGLTEAEKFQRGIGNEANDEEDLDQDLMAQASFGGGSLSQFSSGRQLSR